MLPGDVRRALYEYEALAERGGLHAPALMRLRQLQREGSRGTRREGHTSRGEAPPVTVWKQLSYWTDASSYDSVCGRKSAPPPPPSKSKPVWSWAHLRVHDGDVTLYVHHNAPLPPRPLPPLLARSCSEEVNSNCMSHLFISKL